MKLLLIVFTIAFFALPVIAQDASVIGPKMIKMPEATLPQEARESGLGGRVTVSILIDEAGNAASVKGVSGPDWVCSAVSRADVAALREAAKAAAMDARFEPATQNGRPVPSTIQFNFDFPRANTNNSQELVFSASNTPPKDGSETKYSASNAPPKDGGETKYSASNAPPKDGGETKYSASNAPPKDGGETKYSASNAPPPDYNGPVNPAPAVPKYTVKGSPNYYVGIVSPPDYRGPALFSTIRGEKSTTKAEQPESRLTLIPGGRFISGGVVNGKAVKLPPPPFPPAALAVRATGAVSIQVMIDEKGKIFSAMAVSGHPLLRGAARSAACMAGFSPTLLMGSPVNVSGFITYNFVP